MKRVLVRTVIIVFALLILGGHSSAASVSDLKNAIIRQYKEFDGYLAEKMVLVGVSNLAIGPAQQERRCLYIRSLGRTNCIEEIVQSYEGVAKVSCVYRLTGKTEFTGQEKISGRIWRDNMGQYHVSGALASICDEYQYGCAAGDCVSGLGIAVYHGSDGSNWVFMGRFKGKDDHAYGFETDCSGNCYKSSVIATTSKFIVKDGAPAISARDALKELFDARFIDEKIYQFGLRNITKQEEETAMEMERKRKQTQKKGPKRSENKNSWVAPQGNTGVPGRVNVK